jgi:uncharacterized SAM-dependent methyltransferase
MGLLFVPLSDPSGRLFLASDDPTPVAAAYLLKHLRQYQEAHEFTLNAIHHVARYGAPDVTRAVAAFARGQHPDDFGLQFDLF